MSALVEITSEAEFNSHIASLHPSALTVIYFHTPWAAPCAHMSAVISTIASQYQPSAPPSISFLNVNAEELPDISEDYDVSAVPFVVVVRNGQILESVSGSDAIKVRTAIERHAGTGDGAQLGGAGPRPSIPPPLSAVPHADHNPVVKTATQAPDGAAITKAAQDEEPVEETKEELFARIAELVKAAPVMLFLKGSPSNPQCGFSKKLVGILRERSIKYGFFNILADDDVRHGLKEYAEWPTFPQLWVKGELVGGVDIVLEEIKNDPFFLSDYSVNKSSTTTA